MSEPTKCQYCETMIRMMKHEKTGRPAPIEVDENEGGNVLLNPDGTYHIVGKTEQIDPAIPLYLNHYAACPGAREARQKRKADDAEATKA